MDLSGQLRPIGFAPAEISALMNEAAVFGQHAGDAAFLWARRARALGEPHSTLRGLSRLDERVAAHLDGLRIAGVADEEACRENLAFEGPGEAFVLGVFAFGSGDPSRVEAALSIEIPADRARRGLVSSLGWLENDTGLAVGWCLGFQAEGREIVVSAAKATYTSQAMRWMRNWRLRQSGDSTSERHVRGLGMSSHIALRGGRYA